jgi:hypothetical protein
MKTSFTRALLVLMGVLGVRCMLVVVNEGPMAVLVRVLASDGGFVTVRVVQVVVPMRVLVFVRDVTMMMRMTFGRVQAYAQRHQTESCRLRHAQRVTSADHRNAGTDERRNREDRRRARYAE